MKIVEVCGYYPPHNGGIEFVVKQLAEQLAQNGHEVTVLTAAIGHSPGTVLSGGVREVYQRGFEFAHTTVTLGLFFRLIRLKKDTVVHLHLSHVFTEVTVMIASIIKRFPYVAHYHMDVEASGRLGFLYDAYKRFLLPRVIRRATSLIALSEEQRDILVNRYGAEPDRVHVIPNGVAAKFFIKKRRDFRRSPKRLLYVGRFARQKNLVRLLKTLPLMKQPVSQRNA